MFSGKTNHKLVKIDHQSSGIYLRLYRLISSYQMLMKTVKFLPVCASDLRTHSFSHANGGFLGGPTINQIRMNDVKYISQINAYYSLFWCEVRHNTRNSSYLNCSIISFQITNVNNSMGNLQLYTEIIPRNLANRLCHFQCIVFFS